MKNRLFFAVTLCLLLPIAAQCQQSATVSETWNLRTATHGDALPSQITIIKRGDNIVAKINKADVNVQYQDGKVILTYWTLNKTRENSCILTLSGNRLTGTGTWRTESNESDGGTFTITFDFQLQQCSNHIPHDVADSPAKLRQLVTINHCSGFTNL